MSLFPNLKGWFIQNLDTFEILQGQFPPISTTRELGNEWAEHTAISRTNNILQFLHGKTETISCQVRLYARDTLFNNVADDLAKLESWSKMDTAIANRPSLLNFYLGDGHLSMDCVIDSLSGIQYGTPMSSGAPRDITLTINLKSYKKFSINDTGNYETRYARAKDRDYYELLCQREYNNPMLGDVIRKRHPDQPNLQVGDIVRLPSVEAIRAETVEPKSIALQTAYGKKITPQRTLRLQTFQNHNVTYVSHVIKEA